MRTKYTRINRHRRFVAHWALVLLIVLTAAAYALADGPVPPPMAQETPAPGVQAAPDNAAETFSMAPEATELRSPQLSDLEPFGVVLGGTDTNEVTFRGEPLGGLYDLHDKRLWTFGDAVYWDSYDPACVYATIAYNDYGYVSNVIPVTGDVFIAYTGSAAKWNLGGEYFGLTEAGVMPDDNFRPYYQGKPVLGISDPHTGVAYYEWHINPETGEPFEEDDLQEEGVYLRVRYEVDLIDKAAFETGLYDDFLRIAEDSGAGDPEYRQFGYVFGCYQGDKDVIGFWDPGRVTFLNMLHDEEEETLKLRKDRPEKNPTFLMAIRDADGYLTGFEELTLEAFVKVLRDNNLVGRG